MLVGSRLRIYRLVAVGLLQGINALPLWHDQANAQESASSTKGITISPPLKEVILNPGLLEGITKINISNSTGRDVVASLHIVDFEASDQLGGVQFIQAGGTPPKYGLAAWTSLRQGSSVAIPDGKTVEVPVTIRNSTDLPPGGHYGAVVASISEAGNQGTSNKVSLKQEVASLLFVKKVGGESYGLDSESLQPKEKDQVPSEVNLKFNNTGNTHVIPRGFVEVKDPKGTIVAKGIINPESSMVLPDKSRQFATVMQATSSSSKSGVYTITAYYRYDGQEKFTTKSTSFIKPLLTTKKIMMIIGGLALMVIAALTFIVHRKRLKYSTR